MLAPLCSVLYQMKPVYKLIQVGSLLNPIRHKTAADVVLIAQLLSKVNEIVSFFRKLTWFFKHTAYPYGHLYDNEHFTRFKFNLL